MPDTPNRMPTAPSLIAGVALGAFFGLTLMSVLRSGPMSAEMVNGLLQTAGAIALLSAGYLWGSSNSSRVKDETIHAQATGAGAPFGGAAGTASDPVHVDATIEPPPKP